MIKLRIENKFTPICIIYTSQKSIFGKITDCNDYFFKSFVTASNTPDKYAAPSALSYNP